MEVDRHAISYSRSAIFYDLLCFIFTPMISSSDNGSLNWIRRNVNKLFLHDARTLVLVISDNLSNYALIIALWCDVYFKYSATKCLSSVFLSCSLRSLSADRPSFSWAVYLMLWVIFPLLLFLIFDLVD